MQHAIMKYHLHVSINYCIYLGSGVQAEKINRLPFQYGRHSEANNLALDYNFEFALHYYSKSITEKMVKTRSPIFYSFTSSSCKY